MKQETYKQANYYGTVRKCILTIWGRNKYSVAFFKDPEALSTKDCADYTSRKSAMYSIECFLA